MLFTRVNFQFSDYATEKLYLRLHQKTVLVVLGKRNYKFAGVPKNALIFADDFCSASDLAEYLLYLNKNDTAYSQYYTWRRLYQVFKTFQLRIFSSSYCVFYLKISVWNRILLSPRTNGYLWFLWTLQNAASLSTSAKTSPPPFRHGKLVAPKGQLWKRRWHCDETGSRTVQVYWLLQIWSMATLVVLYQPLLFKNSTGEIFRK